MAKMIFVVLIVGVLACYFCEVRGDEAVDVRASLVGFLTALAGGNGQLARSLGWNASVDPCVGNRSIWLNVNCNDAGKVWGIVIERRDLNGTINATLLCTARDLRKVSVQDNSLHGDLPADISSCSKLRHVYVGGNRLSGSLPPSIVQFNELKVLNVSKNDFSGDLPDGLSKIAGMQRLLANDNHFSGTIPDFNLTGFKEFNVSNNNLTGSIPKNIGSFGNGSFSPNAGLCGEPLFKPCPPSPSPSPQRIVMYLGYVLLGAGIAAFVLYKLCSKKRSTKLGRKARGGSEKNAYHSSKPTTTATTSTSASKSAYSLPASGEQSAAAGAAPSASLVVLRRSGTASVTMTAAAAAAKELRFEDLLKSPAELLGRGRFGSSYKVVVPGGAALAVKRVKDVAMEEDEFRWRMERVGRARHPAVLPPLAFYCAMQEKLVVYEFQSNGSLAKLLHGSIESSQGVLDWPERLRIAAKVADGMAFMHSALRGNGASSNSSTSSSSGDAADGAIAHGNLKASNVLFTGGMEPCISDYGVTAPPLPDGAGSGGSSALRADVCAFGVLLLELLTGKATAAQGDGAELARWVTSVIREEWTAEVFDRVLLAGDAASEQRMVRLLQVAMRCVDAAPGTALPTMREVAWMVNAIREEDDRSLSSEA